MLESLRPLPAVQKGHRAVDYPDNDVDLFVDVPICVGLEADCVDETGNISFENNLSL